MKSIIEHIALTTQLLGAPVSEAALSAEVVRDKKLNVNFGAINEKYNSYTIGSICNFPYRCIFYKPSW